MHYNIEKLMAGDVATVGYFVAADEKWKEMLVDVSSVSVQELAHRLEIEQFWFEENCGGRWPGQEVMAWSGFASLYSTQSGYENNGYSTSDAIKLATAFGISNVSGEVSAHARQAAEFYHLKIDGKKYVTA